MIWELPDTVNINGTEWKIRTDFRDVLRVLEAFEDVNLEPAEKQYICLYVMYPDLEKMDSAEYEVAIKAVLDFIDAGQERDPGHHPRTMDWEQDAPLIFPAVNKSAGFEVRSAEYIHWWTFTGYFMEIKDSVYANVLALRSKKAKGKKLEKNEREFWQQNKKICVLQQKLTDEEKEEKERIKALLK